MFSTLNGCILNSGTKCTFSRAGRESIIDLTFASPELARISNWQVSDLYTHSDHFAVLTTIDTGRSRQATGVQHIEYKANTMDRDRLLHMVEGLGVRGDANSSADAIAETISAACDASMEKVRRGGNKHRPVVWWNAEIASIRRESLAARRRCQRARASSLYEHYAEEFKRKRKHLKEAISQSKARHFQALCDAADRQPFGTAYKMVMGKLRRQPTPTSPRQLENIVRTLFPQQAPLDDQHSYPPESADIALTNAEEIMTGHGCFKAYLHRFKHERNPYCDSCGHDVIEDAEHVAFHCPSFGREREQALAPNTRLTPDNFVATLTESKEGWAAISRMAASIMKELRRRERLRREQEA
ncbi:hypothetical protein ACLKA6_001517 [Drosophila palustris]